MRRRSRLIALASALMLTLGRAGTAAAEEPPPPDAYLQMDVTLTGYLGGIIEHWMRFGVQCDGYEAMEADADLTGDAGTSDPIGPLAAGTDCQVWIESWPGAGQYGEWLEDVAWDPSSQVQLVPGTTTIGVTLERYYVGEWPPERDATVEHEMAVVIDQVLLNRNGGIQVLGAARCDATDLIGDGLWVYDQDGQIIANANWDAIQYVGRRGAITASYDSGIGFVCFDTSDPGAWGSWGTFYAYPSGAPQWIYATNGKFGTGKIHIDADANSGLTVVTQGWLPGESYWGAPYDPSCDGLDGDGFCAVGHDWYGWAQADLKPTRVR